MKTVFLGFALLMSSAFADDQVNERANQFSAGLAKKYKCTVAYKVDGASISPSTNLDRKKITSVLGAVDYELRLACKKSAEKLKAITTVTLSCGKDPVAKKCTPEQNLNGIKATQSGSTISLVGKYVN